MVAPRFVVIGAGAIGKRHAKNLASLGHAADLIPYRDFDPDRLMARHEIAGVIIATATPIRQELIQFCADQDLPFYVEKPLGWTTAQVRTLYDIAAPVAARSMIGFMMRYHPVLLDLVESDLSDIYDFTLAIGHDVRQWRENWSFRDSYAAKPEGGGVLLDLCHELDVAHCLFPDVKVTSVDSLDHVDFPKTDFTTRITLATPAGPVGSVQMDYLSPVSLRDSALRGTQKAIDINWLTPVMVIDDGAAPVTRDYMFDRNDMFLGAMADFVALATGAPTSTNLLLPRFDRMRGNCDLIATAWEARQFHGQVSFELT